jgi:hypothetical protein
MPRKDYPAKPDSAEVLMDRFASITAFVRVAENGGFSAAARALSLSTTTVSDQVQARWKTRSACGCCIGPRGASA